MRNFEFFSTVQRAFLILVLLLPSSAMSAFCEEQVCISDARLKSEVKPFELGLDILMGVSPKSFKYNGLGGVPASSKPELGIIAQDLEKTAPELVLKKEVKLQPTDLKPTEIKQVNYGAFSFILINSVKDLYHRWFNDSQSLHRELTALKNKADLLEKNNQALKAQVQALKTYLCADDADAPFCSQSKKTETD
jgi:trimeric autotransporter adhesin